jgi:hypothetical protein
MPIFNSKYLSNFYLLLIWFFFMTKELKYAKYVGIIKIFEHIFFNCGTDFSNLH